MNFNKKTQTKAFPYAIDLNYLQVFQGFAQGPQVRPGAHLQETQGFLTQPVFFWVVLNGTGDPEERNMKYGKKNKKDNDW